MLRHVRVVFARLSPVLWVSPGLFFLLQICARPRAVRLMVMSEMAKRSREVDRGADFRAGRGRTLVNRPLPRWCTLGRGLWLDQTEATLRSCVTAFFCRCQLFQQVFVVFFLARRAYATRHVPGSVGDYRGVAGRREAVANPAHGRESGGGILCVGYRLSARTCRRRVDKNVHFWWEELGYPVCPPRAPQTTLYRT